MFKKELSILKIQYIDYKKYNLILLFLFLLHQIHFIRIGGTVWDDIDLISTSYVVLEKYKLLFTDPSNPYLSEFAANNEFYGYLVIIPVTKITEIFFKFSNINFLDFEYSDLYYQIRYIIFNLYIILLLRVIFLNLSKIIGDKKSFLFVSYFLMVPSINGHMLFNLKDIPFLLHSLLLVIFLIIIFNRNEGGLNVNEILKIAILSSILLLIRANGILIFIFSYFFVSIKYIVQKKKFNKIYNLIINFVSINLISFLFFILFTPSSWQKPKLYFEKLFEVQFRFSTEVVTLTDGTYISSLNIPPEYLLKWFYFKLPIIFHFAIIWVLVNLTKIKKFNVLTQFSILFLSTFFIIFSFLKPAAYDGIRQYLFLVPFFVFLLIEFITKIENNTLKSLFVIFSFVYLIFTQSGLGAYKYIYFNEFASFGLSEDENCDNFKDCKNWFFDYWGYSSKETGSKINDQLLPIYVCEPKNVFQPYIKNKIIEKNQIIDYKNFLVATLDRGDKYRVLCSELDDSLLKNCTPNIKTYINLRSRKVLLSSIYKCINN